MIQIIALVAGFGFGWFRAHRRGGNTLDKLQYGAGHAIAFFIVAVILTVVLGRLAMG